MTSERWRHARAEELRQAFDRSFAEAPAPEIAALVDLLDVRLGSMPCALRLAEMAGLFADVTIAPVPTRVPELLGITGIRGSLLPVYDLRALLGHPADTKPRWLAVAASAPLGLAFDAFEGHVRVPQSSIRARSAAEQTTHMGEVVQLDGAMRPIVSISAVLETVTSRVRARAGDKE